MSSNLILIFVVALIAALPIAIYFSDRSVEKEARRKADEISYEYDPKNWDTLNR